MEWVHSNVVAIGETHLAKLLLSVLQCVTISVSIAQRGEEEWEFHIKISPWRQLFTFPE